jgi:predicted RNA-binding Zn-ribbon protein involved in translation (DUF1610 family)
MAEALPIFRREEVQRLLRALRDGKIEVLEPKFEGEHGISYPAAADVTGASADEIESILNELSSREVLSSSVVDNIAACPTCGSFRLMIQMRCPTCGSPNLLRGVMIEHLTCGHLDLEENFKTGGQLICPKCGKTLKTIGVDYRRPGVLYKCLSCGGISPNPRKRYTCTSGHSFEEDDLIIREVKSYKLNPAKRWLIEKETIELKSILEKFNNVWRFEAPATIRGQSGAEHEFSFALWLNEEAGGGKPDVIAELNMHEKEVSLIQVLAFQAKAIDVEARQKIFMAMPRLDAKGRLLAGSYGMYVIEVRTAQELQEKVANVLQQIISEREKEALKFEAEKLEKILEEIEK